MLVLTARVNESIIIGRNLIKIKITRIEGQQVRIGFECDKLISINREKIYKAKFGADDFANNSGEKK